MLDLVNRHSMLQSSQELAFSVVESEERHSCLGLPRSSQGGAKQTTPVPTWD